MSNEVYELTEETIHHLPVKLLYVTESKYDYDWHSTFHSHFFTEMIYVTKGTGFFVTTEEKIPITSNQVVVVNENIQHTEESNLDDALEYIALGFQGFSFKDSASDELIPFSIYKIDRDREEVQNILQMLLKEAKKLRYQNTLICQNLLEILLVHLFRNNQVALEKTSFRLFNKDVSAVKYYIDRNYKENITLDQLAEFSHINKYYLAHSFKKSIGLSPIEYLNEVRIGKSKYLLESTDHPISFVASITGFSSPSYFSQSFKRSAGLSPQQYRKMKKEKLEELVEEEVTEG